MSIVRMASRGMMRRSFKRSWRKWRRKPQRRKSQRRRRKCYRRSRKPLKKGGSECTVLHPSDKWASKGVPKCLEDAPATGFKARPKTKAAAKAKVKPAAKTKTNGSMSSGKPKAKAKAKAKAQDNHEKPVDLRCIKGEFIRSFVEDYSPDEPETRRGKYQKTHSMDGVRS